MTIRTILLGVLLGAGASAGAHALDKFRYRNRAHFDDRLDEIEYCETRLARHPRARDLDRVDTALAAADRYMRQWTRAPDREGFAARTGDEAVALAGRLMQLSLDLHLDDDLTEALDEAQLDVCAVLSQNGFVASDADLRALELDVKRVLTALETNPRPPNAEEIAEFTFDVALLTQQAQLARRALGSNYEIDKRVFDLLTTVLGRRRELN